MNRQEMYMSYHKDLGRWLKGKGEYGYMMYPGQYFGLLIGGGKSISYRLELAGIRKWYVVFRSERCKTKLTNK